MYNPAAVRTWSALGAAALALVAFTAQAQLMTINDPRVNEGTGGSNAVVFTVSLNAVSAETITVAYDTMDFSAKAGLDYIAKSGSLTFAPGEMAKTVSVQIVTDGVIELLEPFGLKLSNGINVTIIDDLGLATIIDDDTPLTPDLKINDPRMLEGNAGTTVLIFTVSLNTPVPSMTVTVHANTLDGTAKAGEDYAAKTQVLTFSPGETLKQFTITIFGDTKAEGQEAFYVQLSQANVKLAKATGVGLILNDDGLVDTIPPVISAVASSSITSTGATITWTTNENSNTQIEYGTTTGYGASTVVNASLVTAHSQALTGLAANALYHYRVKSRDTAGNLATSADFTFTTAQVVFSSIRVVSLASSIETTGTLQFNATALDQFGRPMAQQPVFTWSVAPVAGTIGTSGLFTAANMRGTFTITASSGAKSGTGSVTVTNRAPILNSSSTAFPNPAQIREAIAFNAAGIDPEGDALTFNWSFGDATHASGAATTHSYTAAGVYIATLTATDADGASVSETLTIQVLAEESPDHDGGGPLGGPLTPGASLPLNVTRKAIRSSISANGTIKLSGTLVLPEGKSALSGELTVNIGGLVPYAFVLTNKGRGKLGASMIKFKARFAKVYCNRRQ
jgi:hypothetical protein